MKLLLLCIGLVSLLQTILCNDIGNLNEYIDHLLENFKNDGKTMKQIEPLPIPDYDDEKFKTSNGYVYGLSSLKRVGDCTIFYANDSMSIEGHLGVENVHIDVNYKAKALFFWIKGTIEGKVDSLNVRLVLNGTNGVMTLDSFKVVHLGDLKLTKATGLSVVFNWLLRLILNNIAQKSRGLIISNLENLASQFIRENISHLKFPLNTL